MRLYCRALAYFKPDLKLIVALLGVIGLGTCVGLLTAWPMAVLLDSVLVKGGDAAPPRDFFHRLFLAPLPRSQIGQIVGLALIGLLLKLGQDLIGTAQTIVTNRINYNGLLRVRGELFRKLQAMHQSYHREQPLGDAIYRLSSDTYGCQTILSVSITTVVSAATLIVMTALLMTRSVPLTLIAFAAAPVLAIANVTFGRRLKERSLECKEMDSRFTTTVQRSLACIGLVQAFGREGEEFSRFHSSARETVRAWWRLNRQQITYNLIIGTTFGVAGAATIAYGGVLVTRGKLTPGDLLVFTSYLGMLWHPLCALTGFYASMQGGVASAQRVFEVLDRDPVITDAPNAVALPRQPRTLRLEDVSFAYGDEKVLKHLSLTIEPGQLVAFVGTSGGGKSTLLNLIPRFFDPTGGRLTFDGIDARQIRVADVRKHVAMVMQEAIILPTTIAENIAYGRSDATADQIHAAAEMAGAAEFIEKLTAGYQTRLTENGYNLSGGQRQRIGIARALLTEAAFIVLDEPTSALDPHHEHLVTQALRSLKDKRTVILVSHRLSSVSDADQIFVLDRGRVAEHGTHDQLLARRGIYYGMARQQGLAPATDRTDVVPRAA